MRGVLTRINSSDGSGKTRSDGIVGSYAKSPATGESFVIFGDTQFDGSPGTRMWRTSAVAEITAESKYGYYAFKTKSGSEYTLDPE